MKRYILTVDNKIIDIEKEYLIYKESVSKTEYPLSMDAWFYTIECIVSDMKPLKESDNVSDFSGVMSYDKINK